MDKSLYRIIDANFNRAREAIRMMEEYVRFSLNRPDFSSRIKHIRHTLCGHIEKLDTRLLISNRNVAGDIGRGIKVDDQLQRQSLQDCFTAAAKRAGEALRVLAECTQVIDPSIAAKIEPLRLDVYALEKDVSMASFTKEKFEPVRLYVIANAGPDTQEADLLAFCRQCASGDADCIQLRAKNLPDKQLLKIAVKFTQICRDHNTLSIINDRTDIAVLSGADGVHLGQDDIAPSHAKDLSPRPLFVGASTHNLNELQKAVQAEYDYIAVGPAFASSTKPDVKVAGLDYIKNSISIINNAGKYPIAIGGINTENLKELIQSGIRRIAVSNAIRPETPGACCKALKSMLLESY